ncbi:MAG: adenylosuccinate lyase [Bacilli bacterium]|jgi:adenylosuccinate lyase|nr:adenylosuccinate lyase [Bacilli bacterium]
MDTYISPLSSRYASDEMKYIFSAQYRFASWRKLWVSLAKAEKELGLNISNEQIEELSTHVNDIDFAVAEKYEHRFRHEVMAHIYAYGDVCPLARPIIHLGATSSYVMDNGDLLQIRDALLIIERWIVSLITELSQFALKHKDQPILAYTHFQAAQPTTLGKRATLWLNDLVFDLSEVRHLIDDLPFFGCKGTTGTQASFLELFSNEEEKVKELEKLIAQDLKFTHIVPVSGQTYSRKWDSRALSVLSGIAQSSSKFANDIRLMAHLKEADEPFESEQIGSSAMPYKKNPIRSERLTSLARFVMVDNLNPAWTAANQWLERTLDDSANKRLSIAEAFLATDAVLDLYLNIISGLVIYPKMMERHLNEELPFMATENILMYLVKDKGLDRQNIHSILRDLSLKAGAQVKLDGQENQLLKYIEEDQRLNLTHEEIVRLLNIKNFIGRAPQQVIDFISEVINPLLADYSDIKLMKSEVTL